MCSESDYPKYIRVTAGMQQEKMQLKCREQKSLSFLGINLAGVVFQKTNGSVFIGKSQVRKIESNKK